jgi:hypothetical protein
MTANFPVLSILTDDELNEHIETLRIQLLQFADLDRRDATSQSALWPVACALGKLRPRIENTKAKMRARQEHLDAAEVELRRRHVAMPTDWDEPTETDLELLALGRRAS